MHSFPVIKDVFINIMALAALSVLFYFVKVGLGDRIKGAKTVIGVVN